MSISSSNNNAPKLQTRNLGSIIINCAAFAVSVGFAGCILLVLR